MTGPALIRADGLKLASDRVGEVRRALISDIFNKRCPLSAAEQVICLHLFTIMRSDLERCAAAEANGQAMPPVSIEQVKVPPLKWWRGLLLAFIGAGR